MIYRVEEELKKLITVPVETKDLRVNGFRIHYAQAGAGAPMVLIHGANIGWGGWYKNIAALSKYYTVYALDLPGSGYSTPVDFTTVDFQKAFVETTREFIAQLGLSGVTLLGHSLGGWVALEIALSDPSKNITQLIVVDSMGFTDYVPWRFRIISSRSAARLISGTAMSPTRKHMEQFIKDVMFDTSALDKAFVDYYQDGVVNEKVTHPFMLLNRFFKGAKIKKEFVLQGRLGSITQPTVIISGDKDPLIPLGKAQPFFKEVPHAIIEVIQGAGHVPFLEKAEMFNDIVCKNSSR